MKHKKEIAKEIAKSTCMENKSMDLSVQMEQMASGWEIPWSSVCLTKRLAAGVRLATYIGLQQETQTPHFICVVSEVWRSRYYFIERKNCALLHTFCCIWQH